MPVNLNELKDLFMIIELSDFLNLLLVIITIYTVRYASQTLLMEYSSQIIISRYRVDVIEDDKQGYEWEVDIENKGRGHVVKAFILLSMKRRRVFALKQYHLSRPVLDIESGEIDVIKIWLDKQGMGVINPLKDVVKLEVYYQDALNNIYVVSPDADQTNKHLERFEKLPRKIIPLTPRYFSYKYKFRKAFKQKNTIVNRQDNADTEILKSITKEHLK